MTRLFTPLLLCLLLAFSAGAGGRLCLECAREAKSSGRRVGTLPEKLLANAQLIREGARTADVTGGEIADVRRFVERFMDYHLQTRPKSRRDKSLLPVWEKSQR